MSSKTLPLPAAAAPAQPDPLLLRLLAGAREMLRTWIEERRTLALVAELDAATLRDLGLDRGGLAERIRAECSRKAAWHRGWQGGV